MSRKNVVNYEVLNEEVVDGYGVTSDATNIAFLDNSSYQLSWTGDLEGTFAVEASNNYDPIKNTGSFEAVTFNPPLGEAEGTEGSYLIDLNQLPFKWVRLAFTRTDGEGNVTAVFNAKMI